MKYMAFPLITFFLFAPLLVQATPLCPIKLSLEMIKSLRENPKSMQKDQLGKEVEVTAGQGVDEVHTKLPISSRKFEDSVQLQPPSTNPDGSVTCRYNYDKTFGRTGSVEIKLKETNPEKAQFEE